MNQKWKILFYESPSGDTPVQDFIDGLELKAQSKVYNSIEMLQEFGISLNSPHMKKLVGTDLWELRILGSDSIRILYIAVTGKIFLLLHGFKKKERKTPKKDIKIASERLMEYKGRKERT